MNGVELAIGAFFTQLEEPREGRAREALLGPLALALLDGLLRAQTHNDILPNGQVRIHFSVYSLLGKPLRHYRPGQRCNRLSHAVLLWRQYNSPEQMDALGAELAELGGCAFEDYPHILDDWRHNWFENLARPRVDVLARFIRLLRS